VQHLLNGYAGNGPVPPGYRVGLLGSQALIGFGLEAGTGVQVLAHDHVLDLRCLDQQGPQLLAVVDDKLCFRHDGLPMMLFHIRHRPRPDQASVPHLKHAC
jgi:hypothetical protein